MRTLTDHVVQYATYHRDRRNIATHYVGVPMIVLAVVVLTSRPAWPIEAWGLVLSPAWLVAAAGCLFYLVLDRPLGWVMTALVAINVVIAQWIAAQSTTTWLVTGIGLFVVGWIIQFIGHYFEGRKPAFVDDVLGLLIGPLFLVVEAGFALGRLPQLHREVLQRAGPLRNGPTAAQAG